MARLKEFYSTKVRFQLMDEFNYKNVLQVPCIRKIVINMGVGSAVKDKKNIDSAIKDLSLIAGQTPIITRAKKSIAGFKLREGVPIGVKVTLRRTQMYEFLDRLVNVAMPRIRDFRGFTASSFDGCGNFNLGIKEHIVFPEINYDTVDCVRGLDISIETSALTNKEGLSLLRCFNVPFRD